MICEMTFDMFYILIWYHEENLSEYSGIHIPSPGVFWCNFRDIELKFGILP